MSETNLKSHCVRRLLIFSLVFATLFAALYTYYLIISADIAYAPAWVNLVDLICNSLHSLFFATLLGYLLIGIAVLGLRPAGTLCVAAVEMLLYYHLITILLPAIPSASLSVEKLTPILLSALAELGFELIFLTMALLIGLFLIRYKKASIAPISFKKLFALRDPRLLAALVGVFILFLPTLVENIGFEIFMGAPSSASEWFSLVLYWTADIVAHLLLPYLLMVFIISRAEKA